MPFCETTGFKVHYEDDGPSDAPALLVMAGLMGSPYLWPRAWLDRLRQDLRVVLVAHRGTGHSDSPAGEFGIPDLAADAVAVLDHLGIERAHVAGHSMGGMVSQALALDHAERVDRLVLVSTAPGGGMAASDTFVNAMGASLADGSPGSMAVAVFPLLFGEGFLDAHPEALTELALGWQEAPTPFEVAAAQLMAAARFASLDRLGEIRRPTLVLHGTADHILLSSGGEMLAEGIPGARLHLYEGVGHFLPFEVPETAELIAHFLAGDGAGDAAP